MMLLKGQGIYVCQWLSGIAEMPWDIFPGHIFSTCFIICPSGWNIDFVSKEPYNEVEDAVHAMVLEEI